jgi:hypothetical protein
MSAPESPETRKLSADKEEEYKKQIQRYRSIIDQQEEMLQVMETNIVSIVKYLHPV